MRQIHRRQFHLASSTLVLGAAGLRAAPSDRLAVGFIGVGTMGRGHLGSFLGMKDIEVVAVCDVVKERTDSAANTVANHPNYKPSGKQAQKFDDYRKLLDLKGLDAVVIATPDHWHALQAVHAARAGKHIYCEKPLTRTIGEGRKVVEEVAKAGIVFQTGSQQRSEFSNHFRNAVERVRNGMIGKLQVIRIGVGVPAIACNLPAQDIPEGTDWERWVGPAAFRPYHSDLCPKGVHGHFPAWRSYREYAGGGLADMGAHHFDIAQWALDMDKSVRQRFGNDPWRRGRLCVCGRQGNHSGQPGQDRGGQARHPDRPAARGRIPGLPLEQPSPQLGGLRSPKQGMHLPGRNRAPFRQHLPSGQYRLSFGARIDLGSGSRNFPW